MNTTDGCGNRLPDKYALQQLVTGLHLAPERRAKASQRIGKRSRPGQRIKEGARNSTLASLAGGMRRQGMTQESIEAALRVENHRQCDTPLSDEEVARIAASIARYEPGSAEELLQSLNDAGNAERFAKQHGNDVCYVYGLGWLVWDGTRWELDNQRQRLELAKKTARSIYLEAAMAQDIGLIARHAKASLNAPRLEAMVDLASTIPSLVIDQKKLDKDPWLLTVLNGTIDLRTGKLRLHNRSDLITKCAPVLYNPGAKAPRFSRFLSETFANSKVMISYFQRVIGYALTGATGEQVLFFLYGLGKNGKTTLLRIIQFLLGPDFAVQTPSDTLLHKARGNSATNDLARLRGARVVVSVELDEGSWFNESLIKQLTGSDLVTARLLYKEFFDYEPQFKLFIGGNHKPMIRGTDDGVWRRIHLIPCTRTVPSNKVDPDLLAKLQRELPGILNFAVEGCLEWQKQGLSPPQEVLASVQDYREEMDVVGLWLSDKCDIGREYCQGSTDLYASYHGWAEVRGHHPCTQVKFSGQLAHRGYVKKRSSKGQVFHGLRLKPM